MTFLAVSSALAQMMSCHIGRKDEGCALGLDTRLSGRVLRNGDLHLLKGFCLLWAITVSCHAVSQGCQAVDAKRNQHKDRGLPRTGSEDRGTNLIVVAWHQSHCLFHDIPVALKLRDIIRDRTRTSRAAMCRPRGRSSCKAPSQTAKATAA